MNTLFIPVDYSLAAFHAFQYALHIAADFHSRVVLYHACVPETIGAGVGTRASNTTLYPHIPDPVQRAETYLQELEYSIPPAIAQKIEVELHVEVKDPAKGIAGMCQKLHPSILVMGMAAQRDKKGSMYLGSTVNQVMHDVRCPLLVVPEAANYRPIQRIVYGTLYDQDEVPTIDKLLDFAFLHEAVIYCLHVWNADQAPSEQIAQRQSELKARYHEDLILNQLRVNQMDSPDSLQGILTYAERNHMDIIALHTRKRSLWRRILQPSLSKRMAIQTKLPLLIFHD